MLPRWVLGMDTIQTTQIATGIDFWRAFSGSASPWRSPSSAFYQLWATLGRRKAGRDCSSSFGDKRDDQYPATCRHDGLQPARRRCGGTASGTWAGATSTSVGLRFALFSLSAIYPIVLAKTLFPTLVGVGLLVTFRASSPSSTRRSCPSSAPVSTASSAANVSIPYIERGDHLPHRVPRASTSGSCPSRPATSAATPRASASSS